MLGVLVTVHLVTVHLVTGRLTTGAAHRLGTRLRGEDGQTSAEYALVLLGAASVALLLVAWAKSSGMVGDLLDTVFENVTKMVKG